MFTCEWAWLPRSPICLILGFWGSKVHKNGRFPALDATSFILGGEIGNHTNNKCTQKNKRQTVTDISRPCISAYLAYRHVWIVNTVLYNSLLHNVHGHFSIAYFEKQFANKNNSGMIYRYPQHSIKVCCSIKCQTSSINTRPSQRHMYTNVLKQEL